ncbi:MAG: hypothetical protein ACYCO9_05085 [Streptosporangiaceae bacterium]
MIYRVTDISGGPGKGRGKGRQNARLGDLARTPEMNRFWNNPWVITIVGGVIVAIIAALVVPRIVAAAADGHGRARRVQLTIENDRSYGVWTRSTPSGQFSTRSARPANAGQWLTQGATVQAVCARAGGSYHVIFNGVSQTWSWWIKLAHGGWIQSAGVSQTDTSGDGPVPHLPDC